jgi:hypothetical protein
MIVLKPNRQKLSMVITLPLPYPLSHALYAVYWEQRLAEQKVAATASSIIRTPNPRL